MKPAESIIQEISPEQWRELIARAETAKKKVLSRAPSQTSISHITRNLATVIDPGFLERAPRTEERYNLVNEYVNALSKYYTLLDKYPDFREKEQTLALGAFPDLLQKYSGDPRQYIKMAEKRLEGN